MFASTAKPLLLSIFVAGFVFVGAAGAGTFKLKSDPRVCILNNPTTCASSTAQQQLRHQLQVTYHLKELYQGPTSCTAVAGWKSYRCTFGTDGKATVRFTATGKVWQSRVTVTRLAPA